MQKELIGHRYRIKGLIGEGGMASVFAALDEKLDRRVAIKILHPHLARNLEIRQRFLLEAKTVSNLDHPNILRVYDFSGLDSEQLWMVTEILYGIDLAEFLKRHPKGRLHPIVAALVTREIARALFEIHSLEIVHRDIKPENIMMLDSGFVKLMDFGIAKVSRNNATQTGTFMGSPSYMSPEQIRGTDVDVRADIYSLSVLFYETVTGVMPYSGQTTAEVINKIVVGRYTAANIQTPELPLIVNEIIDKGLRSHKEERFKNIQELISALDQFLNGFGFGDSRDELEQYVINRSTFEQRLAKLKLPKTNFAKIEAHKNILDQSKPSSSKNGYTVFTPTKAGKPFITATHGAAQSPFKAPRSAKLPKNSSPSARESASSDEIPTQIVQKLKRPLSPERDLAPVQRAPTILPTTPTSVKDFLQTPEPARTPSKNRHLFREVTLYQQRKKSPNYGTFAIIGLVLAIGLVLLFGGEKLSNRVRKDVSKASQQLDIAKKKKIFKDGREESSSQSSNDPSGKSQTIAESRLPPVEMRNIIIDPKASKALDRESALARASRPGNSSSKEVPSLSLPKTPTIRSEPTNKARITGTGDRSSTEKNLPQLASLPEKTSSASDRIPGEPTSPRDSGTLKILALPAAEIYLDGKLFGTTNDREISGIKLDPGSYNLRLKRKGYKVEEQQLQIRAGELRSLNVTLLKTVDLVELNIRCNRTPASMVIENLRDGGRRREYVVARHNLTVNFKPGNYRVIVSYGDEVINRIVELSEDEPSMTFNAEFK